MKNKLKVESLNLNGIEKVVTAFIFSLILIFKNFSSNIDWYDILEIGATIFIIDFLFIIHKNELEKIIKEGCLTKAFGTVVACVFSICLLYARNSLIKEILSQKEPWFLQYLSLVLANFMSAFLVIVAVLFTANMIAFLVYLLFGKKLIEKFGEKNVSI
ncbi:TPA: hypothetical protein ACGORV_000239 [Streptococcus suis]